MKWEHSHGREAEASVLGGMLLNTQALLFGIGNLLPEDFGDVRHRTLFETILTIARTAETVDQATVIGELERSGNLDAVGGRRHVAVVISAAVIGNIAAPVRVVLEAATRRRLLFAASEINQSARDTAVTVHELVDQARILLADIDLPTVVGNPSDNLDEFVNRGSADPIWLVEDLIEAQDRIMLTSAEGSGKSMMQRQIAVCGGAGIHPFGNHHIEPFRTLIVDLESAEALVRRKLRSLLIVAYKQAPDFKPDNVRVEVRSGGIDLCSRADRGWLTDRIAANFPALVCIGPLYKMYTGDMNEESKARAVAAVLDDLRERFKCAFLIETHAPHGAESGRILRPTGSSLWLRWPEIGLGLYENREEGVGKWRLRAWRRPRDERSWPRKLRRGGVWPWSSDDE